VLRTLRAAFPDADLVACDVVDDAVRYCRKTFGVTGVVSNEDSELIELPGPFDLIWSGSLLTHIPPDRWPGFMRLFESALRPGGLVVFTVYGRFAVDVMRAGKTMFNLEPAQVPAVLRQYEDVGAGFAETFADGDCFVSRRWVCEQLDAPPSLELVLYQERGWMNQDVVACRRRPDCSF
jgi:SAM-dependent methyltransferase